MAFKVIIFVLLIAGAFAEKPYLGFNLPLFDTQIVGGAEAQPGKFPSIVSLQWGLTSGGSHFCAGTIINSQWIVTAAHCIEAVPPYGEFSVKAGKHNLKVVESNEQKVKIAKTFVHNSYPGGVAPYDIGLLKLEKALQLNAAVSPVKLPKANSVPSGNVILTGWGSTSKTSNPNMPDKLQTVVLPLVDVNTCKRAIEDLVGSAPVVNTNVCTGPLGGGFSACSGDSGGPLYSQSNELVGIVSWGIVPCGTAGAPSVYTRVSAYLDWIQSIMSKN